MIAPRIMASAYFFPDISIPPTNVPIQLDAFPAPTPPAQLPAAAARAAHDPAAALARRIVSWRPLRLHAASERSDPRTVSSSFLHSFSRSMPRPRSSRLRTADLDAPRVLATARTDSPSW